MSQTLTLPYPPTANNFKMIIRNRMILTSEARAYKATVTHLARKSGHPMLVGPVAVTLNVYRPRRTGDLDNCLKVLLDSLTGVIWADDSQITEIHAYRHEDKNNPRVEITSSIAAV